MRLGYPCSNLTLGISAARTFRLASYSDERLYETVASNLEALERILVWNVEHKISVFRISSGTIPFGSHPVLTANWRARFSAELATIGNLITSSGMRTNMHPGQYTLLNSPREDVVERSIAELAYHADLMDLMGLDRTHKFQIHTGGVYGDKELAIHRFVASYHRLPEGIKQRLVIENDERQFSFADNLRVYEETGVPLLFDTFHHQIYNEGEPVHEGVAQAMPTWTTGDGVPMLDYSSQHPERQVGAHVISIDLDHFAPIAASLVDQDVDVMLEIKDKETSVLRAMEFLKTL